MNERTSRHQSGLFLATALATSGQKRIAMAIAAASLLLCLAAVPYARTPLAPMPAFIPSYEAALFLIDLITALFLFDQFGRLRSPAMLALASGYLFDALIIVPHALSFPGAFAPTGLIDGGEQTTAWLYVFWHGGFPLFVLTYALLRRREARAPFELSRPRAVLAAAIAGVLLLTIALALLATAGHDRLPIVMRGGDYSLLVSKGISPAVWALTLVAMLSLWERRQRIVDLWLMLVMWIWLLDIALSAVIGSNRFDLGFYLGRVFGLIAGSFLLISLLAATAKLYGSAIDAAASAERRLAELPRLYRPATKPIGSAPADSFIHEQNVAHYRQLLESPSLDEAQRRSIEALLAEEMRKDMTSSNSPPDDGA